MFVMWKSYLYVRNGYDNFPLLVLRRPCYLDDFQSRNGAFNLFPRKISDNLEDRRFFFFFWKSLLKSISQKKNSIATIQENNYKMRQLSHNDPNKMSKDVPPAR